MVRMSIRLVVTGESGMVSIPALGVWTVTVSETDPTRGSGDAEAVTGRLGVSGTLRALEGAGDCLAGENAMLLPRAVGAGGLADGACSVGMGGCGDGCLKRGLLITAGADLRI
jgi:hypothetical protein